MKEIIEKYEKKLQKGKLTEREIDQVIQIVQSMESIPNKEKDSLINELNNMRMDDKIISYDDEKPLEDKEIDASDVKVGESEKSLKINKKKIAKAVAAVAVAGAVVVGGSLLLKSCSNKAPKTSTPLTTTEQDVNKNNIKPTLAFDAENTEVLIANLEETAKDMIAKGIAMEDATLEETVESLTNYYVWMNLNEMGPTYLSKLYQTDSTSYIEIFSDAMYWANAIRFDSITSSKEDNTVLDMSHFIANKKDSELVKEFLDINARLHDAVSKNDKESIDTIASEYKSLIETKLLDHSSYTYGGGTLDLCFRLVYSGEQLVQDYDTVIMDEGLSQIINEDEFLRCYQTISIATIENTSMSTIELETVIQENTSKKSDNVIYIVDTLKDYMNRLNLSLDFTNEKSVADVMVEVSKYIRDNNLLATYKENESLEVFFERIYNQTHDKGHTLTNGDIVTSDGEHYIPEDEKNKYGATSQEDYENKVQEKTEDELSQEDTFTDSDGNVTKGDDAEQYAQDYQSGYEAGSRKGAIDGNALATFNPSVGGSEGYQAGYYKGYKDSYDEAKAYREAHSNQSTTEFTPVENGSTTEEVIEQGNVSNTTEDTNLPEIGSTTDEVIEQGTLNYTPTEDELYQLYYEVLYGTSSSYIDQNVKVK